MRVAYKICFAMNMILMGCIAFKTKYDPEGIIYCTSILTLYIVWLLYSAITTEVDELKKFIQEKFKEKG